MVLPLNRTAVYRFEYLDKYGEPDYKLVSADGMHEAIVAFARETNYSRIVSIVIQDEEWEGALGHI